MRGWALGAHEARGRARQAVGREGVQASGRAGARGAGARGAGARGTGARGTGVRARSSRRGRRAAWARRLARAVHSVHSACFRPGLTRYCS